MTSPKLTATELDALEKMLGIVDGLTKGHFDPPMTKQEVAAAKRGVARMAKFSGFES